MSALATPQRAPKHVVCVSWVPSLAETRELLLKEAGCQVTSIVGAEEIAKLRHIRADLLVLAHSVPRPEKQKVLEIFQASCKAPVLSLLAPHQQKLLQVDFAVEATNPADFIRLVREILAA